MNQKNQITRKDLEGYFQKEFDISVDELLGEGRYFRYTKEGHDMLIAGLTHFTDWKLTSEHGLHIQDIYNPKAFLANPNIRSMNDLPDISSYMETINKLRTDRELHTQLIQKGLETLKDQEVKDELEKQIVELLADTRFANIDALLESGEPERSEHMEMIFKKFSHTVIRDNNIYIIDPSGGEHQQTNSRDFSFTTLTSREQFLEAVKGSRENRDLSLRIQSYFVRNGLAITKDRINQEMDERVSSSLEDVFTDQTLTEKEKVKRLNTMHFFFSEVYIDNDGDLVFPHPDDQQKMVSVTNLEHTDSYFENITSPKAFIDRVVQAREARDRYYRMHEKLKEDPELKQRIDERRKKREQERGEEERER